MGGRSRSNRGHRTSSRRIGRARAEQDLPIAEHVTGRSQVGAELERVARAVELDLDADVSAEEKLERGREIVRLARRNAAGHGPRVVHVDTVFTAEIDDAEAPVHVLDAGVKARHDRMLHDEIVEIVAADADREPGQATTRSADRLPLERVGGENEDGRHAASLAAPKAYAH